MPFGLGAAAAALVGRSWNLPLVGALLVLRLVASRLDVAVASMAPIDFFFFLSLSLATRTRSHLLRAQAHQCVSDRLPAVVSPAPVGASSVREPTNRRVGSRRGQVRRRLVTYHRPFHWRRSSAHSCEVAKSEQGRSHCCAQPSPSPRQSSRLTILASRSKLHSHTVPLDDPRLFQQWPQAE